MNRQINILLSFVPVSTVYTSSEYLFNHRFKIGQDPVRYIYVDLMYASRCPQCGASGQMPSLTENQHCLQPPVSIDSILFTEFFQACVVCPAQVAFPFRQQKCQMVTFREWSRRAAASTKSSFSGSITVNPSAFASFSSIETVSSSACGVTSTEQMCSDTRLNIFGSVSA